MLKSNDWDQIDELKSENTYAYNLVCNIMQEDAAFTAKAAHEIRNPLTLISSSLQLIQAQHPEVTNFKYWTETIDDLYFLKRLLSDLSFYSTTLNLHYSDVDLCEILKKVQQLTQNNREFKFHHTYQASAQRIPKIEADSPKLIRALSNIIQNSYESVPSEDTGIISVAITASKDFVTVEIADNGCGIPSEYDYEVFEPFFTSKKQNVGLGLSISSKIIHAHGGSIHYHSSLGEGTSFFIRLPVRKKQIIDPAYEEF